MRTALLAGAFGLLVTTACDDATGSPLPVIILTNTWQEEGNADHTVFFSDDTQGTARSSGTFTGNESLPNGTEYDISGGWNRGLVSMVTQRLPTVTWRATIEEDNADRLRFTSSAGTLVLVRNVN